MDDDDGTSARDDFAERMKAAREAKRREREAQVRRRQAEIREAEKDLARVRERGRKRIEEAKTEAARRRRKAEEASSLARDLDELFK